MPAVTDMEPRLTAAALIASHGSDIVRGEGQPLGMLEQEGVLRNRLSYLADDLVVPTRNAPFIYDTGAGAQAALDLGVCKLAAPGVPPLFHLTASRLGLHAWNAKVAEMLTTLNDIYRFAVEQVAIYRGHFLEPAIIAVLVLELVLFFLGIMT